MNEVNECSFNERSECSNNITEPIDTLVSFNPCYINISENKKLVTVHFLFEHKETYD